MKTKIHIQFGLAAAAVNFILLLVQFFTGAPFASPLFMILPIASLSILVIAACRKFSKETGGNAGFGEIFGVGFRTTAVTIVIFAILFFLFVWIVPAYKERFIAEVIASAQAADATAADIEQSTAGLKKNFAISALAGLEFMNLIPGLIASVIGAAIARKK
ncbi:DUF4199 domain-containing protein [Chitinophaga sp. GCM10012297]|uniref:DUF4199 domain-containing protein n=1 Tax=Chitinophaga chungangae TaxID=2821488 RepID=A0ABS3YGZ3_9BACT|nr:DUF4199 domain-containing protein [Chitinophaga chungangae]MBO9153957.1 DUF4199 domain-containing protein [Chitinophaga chungangae]